MMLSSERSGNSPRDLQELFQNYAEEYSCEEWDTGAPVGLEKAADDIVSD